MLLSHLTWLFHLVSFGAVLCVEIGDLIVPGVPEGETFLTPDDFNAAKNLRETHSNVILLSRTASAPGTRGDPTLRAGKFEGDILGFNNSSNMQEFISISNRLQRSAVKKRWLLWQEAVIPYTISTKYGAYSRQVIAKAIDEYQKQSCIRFKPREFESDYIHIFPDEGCYSLVGRVGGKQPLSLDAGCIEYGTVLHEMMHTVGFFHEQSRSDRDDYIKIVWENVDSEAADQFEKYSLRQIQTLGLKYDYGSIMHYGPYAFSKNGKKTIIAKQDGGDRMGQRRSFSKTDIAKLNKLYQCDSHTEESDLNPDSSNTEEPSELDCIDRSWRCKFWKIFGYCDQPFYQTQCPKACGVCGIATTTTTATRRQVTATTRRPTVAAGPTATADSDCEDVSNRCGVWAEGGMCDRRGMVVHMKVLCKRTCNFCVKLAPTTTSACANQLPSCDTFAGRGMCGGLGTAVDLMKKYCPKACAIC